MVVIGYIVQVQLTWYFTIQEITTHGLKLLLTYIILLLLETVD